MDIALAVYFTTLVVLAAYGAATLVRQFTQRLTTRGPWHFPNRPKKGQPK